MTRGNSWVYLVLAGVTAVTLYPVLWVLGLALGDGVTPPGIAPLAGGLSGDGFEALFGDAMFGRALLNSAVISTVTAVIGVTLAASTGYALSRFRFFGREATLRGIILSQMFPGVVSAIPLFWLLNATGTFDTHAGLTLVYATTSVPFCAYTMKGWFDTLPGDLIDAGRMDGASEWRIFWSIALPVARPALAITFLFAFMGAWSEFILAQTFLVSEELTTLPVLLRKHVGQFDADWRAFAAGSIVASAPILALFYALQKHLVGGLTAGSVK
jgi:arabinogalactan oligomer/maltooligosaccharide transport system permease protein